MLKYINETSEVTKETKKNKNTIGNTLEYCTIINKKLHRNKWLMHY